MAATISANIGTGTTTPVLLMPWTTRQPSGNIFHAVQDASAPWVSLQAARTREGEHRAFYDTETDASAARDLLATADTFTLDYPERPSIEMVFAVDGEVQMQLDETTAAHWVVQFGYREVT